MIFFSSFVCACVSDVCVIDFSLIYLQFICLFWDWFVSQD